MRRVRIWIVLSAMASAVLADASLGGGILATAPGAHLAAPAAQPAVIVIPMGKRWR